jgi:polyhydroxyalkanoate synthase
MTRASEAGALAAPLDALLIEGALESARRFTPDASTAKFLGRLLTRPAKTGQRLGSLAAELVRVGAGTSDLAPSKRDRRFTDPAWTNNPWLRRIVQAYLVAGRTAEELVGLAELDWRDERRVRFHVQNLSEAMAPSNVPMVNPQSAKEAIDSGGANFVRGGRNLARDLLRAPRIPEMVDTTVSRWAAASPSQRARWCTGPRSWS